MARQDALLKISTTLQNRRSELIQQLADELGGLRHEMGSNVGGDDGDVATETIHTEVTSRIAQLETEEVQKIDHALQRLRDGSYGLCESCSKKINVARLKALPYTTVCIECQREMESQAGSSDERRMSWSRL